MSARYAQALPFGAEVLPAQAGTQDAPRVRFALWAPDCASVALEVEGAPPAAMQRAADGTFSCEVPCRAGARYRYRIAPDLAVPDPASRAQLRDVHGQSIVVDPRAYEWRNDHWRGRAWSDSVVYEIHAGVYGGFDGVRRELPRLDELGVTTLELMPVAEFRGARNWGYDGVLPYAPEASYGAPESLKALVDAAHGLGLAILLDVVYNHFGPDGNFIARYAKGFFRKDRKTPWGQAIDFRQAPVREFFIANALYWLNEYRFDGLRLDAVHAIGDDGFLRELATRVRAGVEPDRIVHLVLEDERGPGLVDGHFDARWNEGFHNSVHVLLTGEHEGYYEEYAADPAGELARSLTQAAPRPSGGVVFLQNHDQVGNRALGERLVALADHDSLRAATLLHLLAPQVPLLFMGEEWGCRKPFQFFCDFEGALAGAVAAGRRREFEKFSAWSDPGRRLDIPDPNARETFDASRPGHGPDDAPQKAWHDYVRGLLRIRRKEIVPWLADAKVLAAQALSPMAVVARWLMGPRVLTIGANFGAEPVAVGMKGAALATSHHAVFGALVRGHLPGASAAAWWQSP